jgi:hypothetical protein
MTVQLKLELTDIFGNGDTKSQKQLSPAYAEEQINTYFKLLEFARSANYSTGKLDRTSATGMKNIIAKAFHSGRQRSSGLRPINADRVEEWVSQAVAKVASLDQEVANQLSAFVVAAISTENDTSTMAYDFKSISFEMDIVTANAQYAAFKAFFQIEKFGEREFVRPAAQMREFITSVGSRLDTVQENIFTKAEANSTSLVDLQRRLVEIENLAEKLKIELEVNQKKHTDELVELASSSWETIKNHEQATNERLNLQSVRQRWQNVRDRAKIAFYTSLTIVVVMALSAIAIAFVFAQPIIDFLTPLNIKTIMLQGTVGGAIGMQLARIAVITIPLVCYLWIMKIAVRILMRSLMLMDDADQRATIMESYYTLANDGKTDERALPMMLWALFRPVPGHGPDGVEPPDFTEAINAGLKGKLLDPR